MKLLDRYVIVSFVKNYLISFLVLVGMYITLDMIFNFDELVEINTRQDVKGLEAIVNFVTHTADFYFYQVFLYFAQLSGIIPVVAASFTLMRMVRFNELSALLSAGVPLQRVAAPILVVALLLNGLLWVDQEIVIPALMHKIARPHDYAGKEAATKNTAGPAEDGAEAFDISHMRDGRGGQLFGRYFPRATIPRIEHLSLVQRGEKGRVISHLKADRAVWDALNQRWELSGETWDDSNQRWVPTSGKIDENLGSDDEVPPATRDVEYYKGAITPEQILLYRSGDFVEFLPTSRINQLLETQSLSYGRQALLRVKYSRGVPQIALNMILLVLAISAVLTREPSQLKLAATRCILLVGICMGVAFIGQELADQPLPGLSATMLNQWPAMMAWLPLFIFGPIAAVLLDRVKT